MRMHRHPWFLFLVFLLWLGSTPQSYAQDHDYWTNLGIYGGRVQDLTFDPQDPQRIFAATYQGRGLYLSRDGGATWQALAMDTLFEGEDTFEEQSVYAVAVAPSNPDIVWAAHNYWVAKSTDGGETWTHIQNGAMQSACTGCVPYDNWRLCTSIVIDSADPEVVYVGTSGPGAAGDRGAVYRTSDGGATWSKLAQFDYRVEDMAISQGDPDTVWAVTNSNGYGGLYEGSLYRSQNGGPFETVSFTFSTAPEQPIGGMTAVAPKPIDPDTVVVGCGGGILQLIFDGTQWNASFPVADSRRAAAVAFSPADPNVVYAAWMSPADEFWQGDGLPKISRGTFDGAAWSWQPLENQGLVENAGDILSLAVDPNNENRVIAGDQGLGVLASADGGGQWTPINQGMDAVIVYDVDADPRTDGRLLAASNAGLYERPARDAAWIRHLNGSFYSASFHPAAAAAFFGGGLGLVHRTTDGGATWTTSEYLGYTYIEDIAVDPFDILRVYITTGHYGKQVMRSTDCGATFSVVLDGVDYSFNTVVVDPHDPEHLLAGGGNFYSPYEVGDLWQSRDGGDTWELTGLNDVIVNAVLIDPHDPDVIYAGCGHSYNDSPPLYKSIDGGVTWTVQTDGLPTQNVGIRDLWAASPQFAVGVGANGLVMVYDGQSTAIQDSGAFQQSGKWLYGVFGLSPQAVWAVGQDGVLMYFDGGQWSAQASGTTVHLNSVWAAAADDVVAVGDAGTILHYDGTGWTPQVSGTAEGLHHVFGFAADDIYAVGANGTILHYDGTGWTPQASGTSNTLTALWGTDAAHLFAVGYEGAVLRYDGENWSVIRDQPGEYLYQVWGTAPDDVYVTANDPERLLHYDGATWVDLTIAGAANVRGVWGSGNTVFVSDDRGGLFVADGGPWTMLRAFGTWFRSVTSLAAHPVDDQTLYAATYKAGVFVSPDRAGNWLNLGEPSHSVYALAAGSLYAATGSGVYQLTGTGVIAGGVQDAITLAGIDNALVQTGMGHQCYSIDGGSYMMVVPAGIFDLSALAENYAPATVEGVTVMGSDVTRQDFALVPGDGDLPGEDFGSGSSGGGCFIDALTF